MEFVMRFSLSGFGFHGWQPVSCFAGSSSFFETQLSIRRSNWNKAEFWAF